jgi:hypothetical protein
VLGKPVGSMGKPIKVELGKGRSIFVCCKGCPNKAQKDPDGMLRKIEQFKRMPPLLPEARP